ncbi:MAG: pyridoxamine 5'-phosphate oxidase family protein [Burkholderiaceae bacterium]|nr:pyridoxamine 5'-phosphate oxidase family protein [Burkholderiaceae bacterium]
MPKTYTAAQTELQRRFGVEAVATRMREIVIRSELADSDKAFIESRDLFFLATVDAAGQPSCSYKGGAPGFVQVRSPVSIEFPLYNGNSMFLSAGNMAETGKVGMLFIDFDTPHRLRVEGSVEINGEPAACARWPGAELVAVATVSAVFVNCPRYIHRSQRVSASRYVPDARGDAPLPAWKRIDAFQDVLPATDGARVGEEGGPITLQEYRARLVTGNG